MVSSPLACTCSKQNFFVQFPTLFAFWRPIRWKMNVSFKVLHVVNIFSPKSNPIKHPKRCPIDLNPINSSLLNQVIFEIKLFGQDFQEQYVYSTRWPSRGYVWRRSNVGDRQLLLIWALQFRLTCNSTVDLSMYLAQYRAETCYCTPFT